MRGIDMRASLFTGDPAALLGMEETASKLGISTPQLRVWVSKEIAPPSARIGRRRYFRARDVDAWLDAQFEPAEKRGA